MLSTIYYFSGTGNSLFFAEKLAKEIDASLVGIASLGKEPIDCTGQSVGLVFPIYMYRPPRLVVSFMRQLVNPEYLFVVAVNGGDPGDALSFTRKTLNDQGTRLDAAFEVRLPDNYLPFGGPPSEADQLEMFRKSDERLPVIAQAVMRCDTHKESRPSWFKTRIYPGLWYGLGYKYIPLSDKKFWLNDKCSACKICANVCPVGNIKLVNDKPTWRNRCEQCMACVQWCKDEAIEMGKKSKGVKRYHNPNVKRKQIIAQKKRPVS
jgi:ferredoxin